MAGGGKKKGKGKSARSKDPPPKEYAIITREELHTKEVKHMQRLNALSACLQFINEDELKVEELKEAEFILEKWLTYLRCEGLPKPYLPPEVRLFFEKLQHFEKKNVEKTIDWLLSVDERSILTQNIFRKDLTKKTLLTEIRPEFGIEYDQDIYLALKVLRSIEYYLDDDSKVALASNRVLLDIVDQKKIIQQEIRNTFDRYVYRILCSEESYMSLIDSLTAEYTYLARNFCLHIWTIRSVPIRFEHLDEPKMLANLHMLQVTIQIPYSILSDNLTVRGLHQNFDHYSEHAKSYEQQILMETESLNAGIQNLHDCLVNEWNMQMDLMQEVRNDLIQKRIDFEERKKALEEELERKAKEMKSGKADDKKGKKEKKPGKLPREPPILTDDSFPDIWEDFLSQEQMQFKNFIDTVYHPNVLMLESHQINLKRFFILGGIYRFNFVEKPRHTDFNKFNITWHENDGNLCTLDDIRIDVEQIHNDNTRRSTYNARQRRSRLSRLSRLSAVDRLSIGEEPIFEEWNEELSPFFVLTFILPNYLCLWGEPFPCQYEEETIYVEEKPIIKQDQPVQHARQTHINDTLATSSIIPTSPHSSINRRNSSPSIGRISANSANRSRQSLNAYRPSLSTLASFLGPNALLSNQYDHTRINLDDFMLDFILTKSQIRNIAKQFMPRTISSFKFPREVRDEEDEENKNKPKGKGGTLVRRRNSLDDDTKVSNRLFSYDNQNNPERLFPVYDNAEQAKLPHMLTLKLMQQEPVTFFELIEMMNDIKRSYQRNVEKIINLPEFRTKTKLPPKVKYAANTPKEPGTEETHKGHRLTANRRISRRLSRRMSHATHRPTHSSIERHSGHMIHHPTVEETRQSDVEDNESVSLHVPDAVKKEIPVQIEEKPIILQPKISAYWTNRYISHYEYNKEKCKVTIWTDRLGTFGFAFKRYEHFPFRDWSLEPSKENPENELVFTLETQYVRVVLYITKAGYHGYVTEPSKKFIRNRAMYLVIDEPLTDFKELKRIFRENNLNIFTEHDARFYIDNGYFSEKHLATEMHTYCCMAIHSSQICFSFSDWNRLAQRRDVVLHFVHHKEATIEESRQLVHITPEEATFVEIKELCSDDLDVFKLEYTLTWRNIDNYADLHHLITSMYPNITESRIKDSNLVCCVKNLLCEIRPLSFS